MNWNEENTKRLRELWNEGVMSATLIGRELGCSRHSVIGKAQRLKLEPRTAFMRAEIKGSQSRIKLKPFKLEPPLEVALVKGEELPEEGIHITNLKWWHCRWPKENILYYCGKVISRGSYCESHGKIAYIESPMRKMAR